MALVPTGVVGMIRRKPWVSLLALLTLLSGVLLIGLRSDIGFFLDDWGLIFSRESGPSDWLLPHNEHIIVLPSAIYKLSLSLFGMTAMPLHLLAVGLYLLSVWLLFFWLRTLVGDPSAVIGCAVLLFLGAAAEDLIWAFQIGFFGSVTAGLGALLLLRKPVLRREALACALLVISLLFSSLAIPFAVGAAVQILVRESSRPDWRSFVAKAWIFAIPALVYIGWWAGWGHLAPNAISVHNAVRAPFYVLSSFSYASAALTGTFPLRELVLSLAWALPGLLLCLGLGYLLWKGKRMPAAFLVAVAMAITFWGLSGLNFMPGRGFAVSRYQYPSVIFLLMILAGAFSGLRPDRRLLRYMALLAAFAIAVNTTVLVYAFFDRYKNYEERNLVSLTAIDLASRTVSPDATVGISLDDVAKVTAGSYLSATDKYGSPALPEEEIDAASDSNRTRLDRDLVGTLPIRQLPGSAVIPDRSRCRKLTADTGATETIEAGSDLLFVKSQDSGLIRVGRFGPGVGTVAGLMPETQPIGFSIPADRSDRPWRIGFQGSGKVTVCPAKPSGAP